jgi:hypothetical protein
MRENSERNCALITTAVSLFILIRVGIKELWCVTFKSKVTGLHLVVSFLFFLNSTISILWFSSVHYSFSFILFQY